MCGRMSAAARRHVGGPTPDGFMTYPGPLWRAACFRGAQQLPPEHPLRACKQQRAAGGPAPAHQALPGIQPAATLASQPQWHQHLAQAARAYGGLPEQGGCVSRLPLPAAPSGPALPANYCPCCPLQAEAVPGPCSATAAPPPLPPLLSAPAPQSAAAAPSCDGPSCTGPSGAAVLEAPREDERLKAVHALHLIGIEPKPALDSITKLMAVGWKGSAVCRLVCVEGVYCSWVQPCVTRSQPG